MLPNLGLGLVGGLVCGVSAGALAFFCTPFFQVRVLPKPEETSLADTLQFKSIGEDGETLITKDDQRVKVIELRGLDISSKTDQEIQDLLHQNQLWLDTLIENGILFKIITTRRKVESSMEGTYDHPLLQKLHDKWMEGFKETYVNRHYIIVTTPKDKDLRAKFKAFKRKKSSPKTPVHGSSLNDLVDLTLEYLSNYRPVVLNNRGERSALLSFWGSLLSREQRKVPAYQDNLSQKLVTTPIEFKSSDGILTYESCPSKKYESLISIKVWGEESRTSILKEILSLPGEVTLLHIIRGIPRYKASATLKYKRAEQKSFLGKDEINAAIEIIDSEEASLCEYQFSLFVMAETLEELNSLTHRIKSILRDYGIETILERDALEWIWRSQFPGFDEFVRKTQLLSYNLSHFINFEFTPIGLPTSDWGKGPIRYFKTATRGTYAFQFHVSEDKEALGHCVMIAPTGSGKTTLIQHLIAGAMRFPNFRAYMFDRLNGTKIFTESMGGSHIDLSSGKIPLNPLVCEDTISNRKFLELFLRKLSKVEDTDENKADLSKAVDLIFKVPSQSRTLTDLYEALFPLNSRVRKALYEWVKGNSAHWFNGTHLNKKGIPEGFDALNFESSRLVTFEMEQIQRDPHLAGVMNDYIFYKIRSATRGRAFPHFIFIDEAGTQLGNKDFKSETKTLLSEIRKLQGVVCLAFQRIQQMRDVGIDSSTREECPTAILFQNAGASLEDYKIFNVTESEMDFIKGRSRVARDLKHSVLIKREKESVILDVSLGCLGPELKLYKSGNEAVQLVKQLKNQFGGDQWVEEYLKAA